MKGADDYYNAFKETQQIGRLYIVLHTHARGKCFQIYVLPDGEDVISNGDWNPPLNKDAIEVYGIVCGQPGWTEEYGWLHDGKWQEDFNSLYKEKLTEAIKTNIEYTKAMAKNEEEKGLRISNLLSDYK